MYCQRIASRVFMILFMGCAVARADRVEIEPFSPSNASALYTGKKAVIVDAREDSEWNEQHIPGAIRIPLGQLNARLSKLKQYKK